MRRSPPVQRQWGPSRPRRRARNGSRSGSAPAPGQPPGSLSPWPAKGGSSLLPQRVRLLHPALDRQVGGHLHAEGSRRALQPERVVGCIERQQIGESNDARLREQRLLIGPEIGQIEQQRLVTPFVDVVRSRADLIGQVLTARARFGHLEQQARGEDALTFERLEVEGWYALEIFERRHRR